MAKQQQTKPATKNVPAVSKKGQSSMVVVTDQVPDYIRQDSQRGSENVGMADLVIPRLEIVQGLSPAVKRGDPGFIQGAAPGMLNNSVTRQLYGENVVLVPLHYSVQYLVWRDRKHGGGNEGGFFGAYPTMDEARVRVAEEGGEAKGIMVVDTPQHLCLLINPDTWAAEEIMLSMPRTKAKISRQWNTMIRLAGGDRFGRVYKVSTIFEKNAKGDFYNFHIEQVGFPTAELYARAEALYKKIAAGERRVVMDTSGLDTGAPAGDEEF